MIHVPVIMFRRYSLVLPPSSSSPLSPSPRLSLVSLPPPATQNRSESAPGPLIACYPSRRRSVVVVVAVVVVVVVVVFGRCRCCPRCPGLEVVVKVVVVCTWLRARRYRRRWRRRRRRRGLRLWGGGSRVRVSGSAGVQGYVRGMGFGFGCEVRALGWGFGEGLRLAFK